LAEVEKQAFDTNTGNTFTYRSTCLSVDVNAKEVEVLIHRSRISSEHFVFYPPTAFLVVLCLKKKLFIAFLPQFNVLSSLMDARSILTRVSGENMSLKKSVLLCHRDQKYYFYLLCLILPY